MTTPIEKYGLAHKKTISTSKYHTTTIGMSKVSYQHTMSSSNNPLVVKEGSAAPIHENGFIINKILKMN